MLHYVIVLVKAWQNWTDQKFTNYDITCKEQARSFILCLHFENEIDKDMGTTVWRASVLVAVTTHKTDH